MSAIWSNFEHALKKRTSELISEREAYLKWVHDENQRRHRRSNSSVEQLSALKPSSWEFDTGFDPYHVRSHRKSISHSITKALKLGKYQPRAPFTFEVPKGGGGKRLVSTFQIADEIVSLKTYQSLLNKNFPVLSSRAYAYRYDRGPHEAISFIHSEFLTEKRVFIAEYDIRGFFDNVDHEYLLNLLNSPVFRITELELQVVKSFLNTPILRPNNNGQHADSETRIKGIPQGTSLSLFLANVVAYELDRKLERLGVSFVRFADDTLIWSSNYDQICRAAEVLYESAERIGVEINETKSPGIRLLMPTEAKGAEMASTSSVDFLGHTLDLKTIHMKKASIQKIKNRVEHLVYTNLLLEPMRKNQNIERVSHTNVDRDYVTLIFQIRRYLYGSLSESDIEKFKTGDVPRLKFDGVMSYFPLVNDESELITLDNWIVNTIWLAMRKRTKLLSAEGLALPKPHGLSRSELSRFKSYSRATKHALDLRIPSVQRISTLIGKAVNTHGLQIISDNKPFYTYTE